MAEANMSSARTMGQTLLHEGRAALNMAGKGLSVRRRRLFPSYHSTCLVLPGYIAPQLAYRDFVFWCRSNGVRTRVANFGFLNRPSFERQAKLLQREATKFHREVGDPDILIGHSLGGLEVILLLEMFPNARKIIAIASPFSDGTPWGIVELGARIFIKVPEAMQAVLLKKIYNLGTRHVDRIVTIATEHDKLVPPDHAAFPGARNIIVEDVKGAQDSEDELFRTHTALPNSPFVREIIILPELKSK
jgi:pimeloyl-ACP methyl ester carboxylesterase